jgi:cytochrome b
MARLQIRVWDAVVRIGHWTLAASFLTAYFTAESESLRLVHTTSGLVALAVVLFRIVWGFLGPVPARFASFIQAPHAAWVYLKSVVSGCPDHHTGHNPAGGWAVLGLLGLTLLTAATGLANYNEVGGNATEKAHDVLANLSLAWVIVHVAAVLISSYLHRENLLTPMFTGKKLGLASEEIAPRTGRLAAVLLLLWAVALAVWLR